MRLGWVSFISRRRNEYLRGGKTGTGWLVGFGGVTGGKGRLGDTMKSGVNILF